MVLPLRPSAAACPARRVGLGLRLLHQNGCRAVGILERDLHADSAGAESDGRSARRAHGARGRWRTRQPGSLAQVIVPGRRPSRRSGRRSARVALPSQRRAAFVVERRQSRRTADVCALGIQVVEAAARRSSGLVHAASFPISAMATGSPRTSKRHCGDVAVGVLHLDAARARGSRTPRRSPSLPSASVLRDDEEVVRRRSRASVTLPNGSSVALRQVEVVAQRRRRSPRRRSDPALAGGSAAGTRSAQSDAAREIAARGGRLSSAARGASAAIESSGYAEDSVRAGLRSAPACRSRTSARGGSSLPTSGFSGPRAWSSSKKSVRTCSTRRFSAAAVRRLLVIVERAGTASWPDSAQRQAGRARSSSSALASNVCRVAEASPASSIPVSSYGQHLAGTGRRCVVATILLGSSSV